MTKHSKGVCKGQRRGASGRYTLATKPKFVTPTSGHKHVYFTTRSTKDAVAFQGARHVSTATGWKQGPMLGKAMTNLRDLMFDLLSRPVWEYYKHMDGTVITDWATARTKNVTVIDDLNYAIETREYSCKISYHKIQLEV